MSEKWHAAPRDEREKPACQCNEELTDDECNQWLNTNIQGMSPSMLLTIEHNGGQRSRM
jgi:hypothetical protein